MDVYGFGIRANLNHLYDNKDFVDVNTQNIKGVIASNVVKMLTKD